jgi:hypothetical protein
MLQTGNSPTAPASTQGTPHPTSTNPAPISVPQTQPHPVFGRLADGLVLKYQMPEMLAHWLKLATAEFVRLRDDASSGEEEFDAAAGTMDEIYNALIRQKANRPSVVALQLEAVAAQTSLHARKGYEPELGEAIEFADFQQLVDNLVAATAPIAPRKRALALKRGRKLTRAGLLTRYQSFLVQELETVSWELYGQRDLGKHQIMFDAAVSDRCRSTSGPFLEASKLTARAGKVLKSLKIDTELSEEAIRESR